MSEKTQKIIFWVTTLIIVLMEGVMPAFYFNNEAARQGIQQLGYPEYFRIMLTVFKILGALVLVLPNIHGWIKEWAYAGFAFDFIAASVSHAAMEGLGFNVFFPLIFLIILLLSHYYYRRLQG